MTQASSKSNLAGPSDSERRVAHRRRTLFSGKIVFNRKSSVLSCIVRNLSETGACLEIETNVGIPDQFELLVEGAGIKAEYRVIWRSANRIGVKRVDASGDLQDDVT